MDEDVARMTHAELLPEVKKLRKGIREHRDASGHELCWHHPALWGLLPEKPTPFPSFRSGLSSCEAASSTGSRWISIYRRRDAPRLPIQGE